MALALLLLIIMIVVAIKVTSKQHKKLTEAQLTEPTLPTTPVIEEIALEEIKQPVQKKRTPKPKSDNPTKTLAARKPKKKDSL